MARGINLPTGPSALSRLVAHLKAPPKLSLPHIRSLRLTLAARNDHFGARYFLKEQLPRIRYANPDLEIHVRKMAKRPKDEWRPELQLSFHDGKTQSMNLHAKWSSTIVRELMDTAGSLAWARWKTEAERSGVPIIHGAEHEPPSTDERPMPRFWYDEWRAKHPQKARRLREASYTRRNAKEARGVKGGSKSSKETTVAAGSQTLEQEHEKRRATKKEARRARLDAPRLAEVEAERRVQLELLSKPRTGAAAVLP
ncbi:hypothetical protein GGX14DRAFT_584885 [Mycena pura]|uniref:Ribosomal protein/NADH dehydrogenase domain-containing protein n=1 Tax=Mycena pura TaxID=153505 RepID=A0AAD6VRD0_9AGAR|nr:hypothetical protein GGX14DRAFT_584885 [Mycena pura]